MSAASGSDGRAGSGASSGPENATPAAPTAGTDSGATSPLRIAILNFSSQWFIVPQGAGITALVLHQLDYRFQGQQTIAYVISAFTALSLALSLVVYLVRTALYPRHVAAKLSQNVIEVACLSSISIAFTSLIQMLALALGENHDWGLAVCILWWINAVLALAATIVVPYVFVVIRPPGVSELPPAALLPFIAAITLAAGGGVVGQMTSIGIEARAPILLVSFLFLGIGMPLALLLSTAYLVRLLDRAPAVGEKVYQEMILCGPWGQGSFALQALAKVLVQEGPSLTAYSPGVVFSQVATAIVGYESMFLGFISWGQGTFWWLFAITSILHSHCSSRKRQSSKRIPYNLAEWSMVFPWVSGRWKMAEMGTRLLCCRFLTRR